MNPEKTTIKSIYARQIYDSRGNPTIEVDVTTELGLFRASVPSGASTGIYEALELRDGIKSEYHGKGVLKAVKNVNTIIAPALIGKDPLDQAELDRFMVEELDGTMTEWGRLKSKLGANSILAVSLAISRAGAAASHLPLYEYISKLAGYTCEEYHFPVPSFNIINGGAHSGNSLVIQEFMILPVGAKSFTEAMRIASEIYHTLKKLITKKYGSDSVNVGDEGGFAPNITNAEGHNPVHPAMNSVDTALDLICEAIRESGYAEKVRIGMDVAASEFYDAEHKKYDLMKKARKSGSPQESEMVTSAELLKVYEDLVSRYPIISIEDGFEQDDFDGWSAMLSSLGDKIDIVGDDLTVTNMRRIQKSIDQKCANSLLLKMNQIGSVTEAIEAVRCCREKGNWTVMTSHRSGETEDCYIAHLSVGLHTETIKTGAPCRGERLCKYNEIMRIEEELVRTGKKVFLGNTPVELEL